VIAAVASLLTAVSVLIALGIMALQRRRDIVR
jgi:hypothetical protein